eukprot:TRINITY_DN777964_c0_g1_i1.p1 TRINITY_DN777964_c0_g1~~TRINITY_DN777964_c0_g1_i1.p1  ORF type:complete len:407 (+),score=122.59 TRINITY_DN777964_c0_g1_i1:135-1223(+)
MEFSEYFKLFIGAFEATFSAIDNDNDKMGILNTLVHLMVSHRDEETVALLDILVAEITKHFEANFALRLIAVFFNVFNAEHFDERIALLIGAINIAKTDNKLMVQIVGFLKAIVASEQRNANVALWQKFCEVAFEALKDFDHEISFAYLRELLYSFTEEPAKLLEQPKIIAAAVNVGVRNALNRPCAELLQIPAVTALQGSTSAKSFDLLELFAHKDTAAYMEFEKTETAFIEEMGLDKKQCLHDIRLLTLLDICANVSEVSYDVVATSLSIPSEDIEEWIVTAVTDGLVDARLDQLARVVTVSNCSVREFNMEHWKTLGEKLSKWKTNLTKVVEKMNQSHITIETYKELARDANVKTQMTA